MIVSHKHRYIFIHCRKTAGSSIAMALAKSLGPWDIQLSALQETLDAGAKIPAGMYLTLCRTPAVYIPFQIVLKKIGWNHALALNIKRTYAMRLGRKPQHADAGTIKATYPHEWESYTKFCVVRNPFSLAVSDYNWRTRHLREKPTFTTYLNALLAGDDLGGVVPVGFHNNWRQYSIGDQVVVDEVLRYENINQDLAKLLFKLNVPFSGKLPKLKDLKPRGEGSESYSAYYTSEAVELVEKLYSEEINAFGYKFEGIK